MSISKPSFVAFIVVAFSVGFALRGAGSVTNNALSPVAVVNAAAANRVFEFRTYTAAPGKLEALKARFRDHTITIFNKHNMTSIGYWVPQDAPGSNTLVYILAHPSRQEATKNWDAFKIDPDWVKTKADSEVNGPLTTKVESVFADPQDFSPIK